MAYFALDKLYARGVQDWAMDVKAVIADLNMTPSEFARKLGVSKGHVGDLISERRQPSLKLAAEIAKLAGRKSLLNEFVKERLEA